MKFKHGVNPDGVCREIWWALGVATQLYKALGKELVVTSLSDGKHSIHSLHYVGEAADIRTRDFKDLLAVEEAFWLIRKTIDPRGFDTVLEKDHIHIEFQPHTGEKWMVYTD